RILTVWTRAYGMLWPRRFWPLWLVSLRPPCGVLPRAFWPRLLSRHGPPSPWPSSGPGSWRILWRISCAFSWTYAFLSSLSADQPIGYCGSRPEQPDSCRLLGKFDGHGVWLQGIRRTTRPLVEGPPD